MGSANITLDSLVGADVTATEIKAGAIHPSDSINALKLDAGYSAARIQADGPVSGTIVGVGVAKLVARPTFAANVVEFNRRVLKIEPRPISTLVQNEYEISIKCLQEELDEFKQAYESGDIIGMIDSIIDLKYFGDGVLYKMGLTADTIDKVGDAVHAANMEKKLGVNARRGDGSAADAVKPEGWQPPEERIAAILDEQQAE